MCKRELRMGKGSLTAESAADRCLPALPWNHPLNIRPTAMRKLRDSLYTVRGATGEHDECVLVKNLDRVWCQNRERLRPREYIYRRCLGISKRCPKTTVLRSMCKRGRKCVRPDHQYRTIRPEACAAEIADRAVPAGYCFFRTVHAGSKRKGGKEELVAPLISEFAPADANDDSRLQFGRVPANEIIVYDEAALQASPETPAPVEQKYLDASATVLEAMLGALQKALPLEGDDLDQPAGALAFGHLGPHNEHDTMLDLTPYDADQCSGLNLDRDLVVPVHRVTNRICTRAVEDSKQYYYKRMSAREFFDL